MGKKKKLEKFAAITSYPNVFEHGQAPKGKWETAFEKKQPLVLELACGKGEYTIGLAGLYPDRNYVGVDIKGNRIWRGATTALENEMKNVAFLRCQIARINDYFEPGEVNEIWITFPDPQPREGKAKKRLTHPMFLNRYFSLAGKPIIINLKTDSDLLYQFTLETIAEYSDLQLLISNNDIYNWDERPKELNIKTFYENMWQEKGIKSKYIRFQINAIVPWNKTASESEETPRLPEGNQ
ncbi:MAG: tRNA (guanosine(46)-N7)-methyltransferase TrmB [Bacteroidetes bacterium]|nr:tRNA (guanosine(46)-N7)-methyltransferase TrmB [Bacteroidota bacterium]